MRPLATGRGPNTGHPPNTPSGHGPTAVLASLAPFVALLVVWQLIAVYGGFNAKLVPRLGTIAATFIRLAGNGILLDSAAATLYRLLAGFLIAACVGIALGLVMGSNRKMEEILLPPISFFYPIPGIAYAPLFVLWFGLGDTPAILLVAAASTFPIAINTWKGVLAVRPIWLQSAWVMGARDTRLFIKIIFPGSLPYVLVGLRLGLATAWRILVAVEMLTSVKQGLGWLIFGSQAFLETDVMLSSIIVIGVIGFALEKTFFQLVERNTLVRWGMLMP
ncbi:MAG: ABC transporter permease [Candidimonas sp.]|nr:MAG: ABC transporter permease [Candidimonas sp.]